MADDDDTPIQDPYQFYNNRYLRRADVNQPEVHSYSSQKTSETPLRDKRKIKLFPLYRNSSSREKFVSSGKDSDSDKTGNSTRNSGNNGYLPAELSVQDLLPRKSDDKKHPSSTENVVIVTARDSSVLGEMKVDLAAQSNPYNKVNQYIHSALWFPGFVFLFLLFCLPAVHLMRKSDEAYALQDFKLSHRRARASTVLYVAGLFTGVCFYVVVICLAIYLANN